MLCPHNSLPPHRRLSRCHWRITTTTTFVIWDPFYLPLAGPSLAHSADSLASCDKLGRSEHCVSVESTKILLPPGNEKPQDFSFRIALDALIEGNCSRLVLISLLLPSPQILLPLWCLASNPPLPCPCFLRKVVPLGGGPTIGSFDWRARGSEPMSLCHSCSEVFSFPSPGHKCLLLTLSFPLPATGLLGFAY